MGEVFASHGNRFSIPTFFSKVTILGGILLVLSGLAYAFCAFVATFFLGQRITGQSEWPPYWAIFLIYLLAPLAPLAAGAAKGAIGNMGSGGGSSGGSGKGSGQDFKGGGGTFGGGGASGGW